MSHSRNRRPLRTREPPRKTPADYATNNANENGATKDKIKIPRNVRYDLENALLGLCDVWFEEIKPHLVKNNLKLHTGGALNENGYSDLEPSKEPQRVGRPAQLDPDDRSNQRSFGGYPVDNEEFQTRRRAAARSRVYSPTRPVASKAPYPNPEPPLRTSPLSPTNLCKLLQTVPQRRSSPPYAQTNQPKPTNQPNIYMPSKQPYVQKAPPQRSILPSTQNYHQNVKHVHYRTEQTLEKVRLGQPNQRVPNTTLSPSPPMQPPSMQFHQQMTKHENDYNTLKQNPSSNRRKRKNARARKKTQIPSSTLPALRRSTRPCCMACAFAKDQTNANPQQTRTARTLHRKKGSVTKPHPNNKITVYSHPKLQHISVPTQDRCVYANRPSNPPVPFCRPKVSPAGDVPNHHHFSRLNPSGRNEYSSSATPERRCRKNIPFSLHNASVLPSPLHAKCLAPPEHPIAQPRENQTVVTTLSPEPSRDELWFLRVFNDNTRPQSQVNIPINKHQVNNKCSNHTTTINNEKKLRFKDSEQLFSKELIDLIGDKNDERLKVLYENPTRQESQPSIMCLVGYRKTRTKTAPKKIPWR